MKAITKGIAVALFALAGTVPVFAHAVGFQLDAAPDSSGAGFGPAITFKIDEIPLMFAVSLSIHGNDFSLGATADHWFIHEQISDSLPIMWGIGWGAYGHVGITQSTNLSFGGRLPIFLDAFFKDGFLEPFIQIAPSIGIAVAPELVFPDWSIPFSIGLRFWFNESSK